MNSLDLNILQDMSNIHHIIENDVRNYINTFLMLKIMKNYYYQI